MILNASEPTNDPVAEATNPAELASRLGAVAILGHFEYEETRGTMPVVMDGSDWYNRVSRPRFPFPVA